MQIGKVVGTVVSTRKALNLSGLKLLLVRVVDPDTMKEKGAPFISIDTVGAGEGEIVMLVGGSSSRQTELTDAKPVDNCIAAIIDHVDLEGRRVFDKSRPYKAQQESAPTEKKQEAAMQPKESEPAAEHISNTEPENLEEKAEESFLAERGIPHLKDELLDDEKIFGSLKELTEFIQESKNSLAAIDMLDDIELGDALDSKDESK